MPLQYLMVSLALIFPIFISNKVKSKICRVSQTNSYAIKFQSGFFKNYPNAVDAYIKLQIAKWLNVMKSRLQFLENAHQECINKLTGEHSDGGNLR